MVMGRERSIYETRSRIFSRDVNHVSVDYFTIIHARHLHGYIYETRCLVAVKPDVIPRGVSRNAWTRDKTEIQLSFFDSNRSNHSETQVRIKLDSWKKISFTRQLKKRKRNCNSRNLHCIRHFTSTGEKLNKASNKHYLTTILQFFHGKFQDFVNFAEGSCPRLGGNISRRDLRRFTRGFA